MRMPDVLIVGAAKSGTTSLFRWLGSHTGVYEPTLKEPGFFSDPSAWERGLAWYGSIFEAASPDQLALEASVAYTSSENGAVAANRIASTLPSVQLVYLVRDPLERARSHYRHEVQRSREKRSFLEAISTPHNTYLENSLYFARLQPYVDLFPREQIHVVSFERLTSEDSGEWDKLLARLGLTRMKRPEKLHNETATKPGFTPFMLWLWEKGWTDRLRPPKAVRRLSGRFLLRVDAEYRRQLALADVDPPKDVEAQMAEEADLLEAWWGAPLWSSAHR